MNPTTAYIYAATVVRVVDGDTAIMDIDLGFYITARYSVRLLGCNAAEHGTPSGDAATAYLTGLLAVGSKVLLRTVLVDKYGGRVDAQVTLPDGRDLVSLLVSLQFAAPWNGTGPRPLPPWPRTVA